MVRECAYVRMCVCVYVCTMYMRIWVVPPPPAFGPQPRSHLDYDHHNHHRQEMMRGHRFTQAYCLVSVRRLSSSPSRCWAHSRTTSVGNPFCCSAPRRQCVSLTTHSRTVPRCCDATTYNADIRSPTHPLTHPSNAVGWLLLGCMPCLETLVAAFVLSGCTNAVFTLAFAVITDVTAHRIAQRRETSSGKPNTSKPVSM